MPQKSIVLVSHSLDEAITTCIKNNLKNLEADVKIIALQELMSDYEIFDEVNDAGTNIKWVNGLNQISNEDYLLLNRVLYVPNSLFTNFTKLDQEYAQREFEAYIGFSFNTFNGVGNYMANGACVDSVSLPTLMLFTDTYAFLMYYYPLFEEKAFQISFEYLTHLILLAMYLAAPILSLFQYHR